MDTLEINPGDQITVRVLKYDGAEYRRWNALVTRRAGSLIILNAEFEYDVQHQLLGNIQRGTRTIEYYWLDRWYNIFQFLDEAGRTRVFYCNINTPPTFADGTLSYVDLDIDVLVQPDLSCQVLDLEEFRANAVRYDYSGEVESMARAAVDELISLIERREFPFTESALPSSVSSVVN
jgi:protein associated with RNAse G/E